MGMLFQRAVRRSHVQSQGRVFHAKATEDSVAIRQEWVWKTQDGITRQHDWSRASTGGTDDENESKEAAFGQILCSPSSASGRATDGYNTGSLPLREPTAWWGKKSVPSRLVNVIPKARMRCAGSSVFGTSSRTGFLAEESRV